MTDFEQDLQKYQRQLDKGFNKLHFDDGLEEEFLERYFERNLIKQRTALSVAFFLLLLLAPLDYRILQASDADTLYIIIRLWVSCPLLLITFWLTYTEFFKRQAQNIAFMLLMGTGISTNLVVTYAAIHDIRTLYEGIILIIFVGYLLAGLRFRYSITCNLIIGLSYLALSIAYMPPSVYDYHSYFFIFGAIFIGGAASYTLEYQARLGFLQRGALRNSAKVDPLTRLLNRGAINQSLHTILDYAKREKKYISLLLLDVDYFKKYNDFYGHVEGDNALIQVANCLANCCRRSLDFAGRYGGEEFILVWFDTNPQESKHLCDLVQEKIATINIPHQQSLVASHLTLSGGLITAIPTHSTSTQSLITKADELLYQSKDSGRNRISIHSVKPYI